MTIVALTIHIADEHPLLADLLALVKQIGGLSSSSAHSVPKSKSSDVHEEDVHPDVDEDVEEQPAPDASRADTAQPEPEPQPAEPPPPPQPEPTPLPEGWWPSQVVVQRCAAIGIQVPLMINSFRKWARGKALLCWDAAFWALAKRRAEDLGLRLPSRSKAARREASAADTSASADTPAADDAPAAAESPANAGDAPADPLLGRFLGAVATVLGPVVARTWFRDVTLEQNPDDGGWRLIAPSRLVADWIRQQLGQAVDRGLGAAGLSGPWTVEARS